MIERRMYTCSFIDKWACRKYLKLILMTDLGVVLFMFFFSFILFLFWYCFFGTDIPIFISFIRLSMKIIRFIQHWLSYLEQIKNQYQTNITVNVWCIVLYCIVYYVVYIDSCVICMKWLCSQNQRIWMRIPAKAMTSFVCENTFNICMQSIQLNWCRGLDL